MTHPVPTGLDLVQETVRLSRALAAGAGKPGDAEQLVTLGKALARRSSATFQTRQQHHPRPGAPAAINLMNAVGNAAIVSTAGEIRSALAERPAMGPEDYLKSLSLATLPSWPLPDDNAAEVVVYRRSGAGFGKLWNAIGCGDAAETDRAIAKLNEGGVDGPSAYWARGLGD